MGQYIKSVMSIEDAIDSNGTQLRYAYIFSQFYAEFIKMLDININVNLLVN